LTAKPKIGQEKTSEGSEDGQGHRSDLPYRLGCKSAQGYPDDHSPKPRKDFEADDFLRQQPSDQTCFVDEQAIAVQIALRKSPTDQSSQSQPRRANDPSGFLRRAQPL
jgi:hypothetical protein